MKEVIQFQLHVVFQVGTMNCIAYLINAKLSAQGLWSKFLGDLL